MIVNDMDKYPLGNFQNSEKKMIHLVDGAGKTETSEKNKVGSLFSSFSKIISK